MSNSHLKGLKALKKLKSELEITYKAALYDCDKVSRWKSIVAFPTHSSLSRRVGTQSSILRVIDPEVERYLNHLFGLYHH